MIDRSTRNWLPCLLWLVLVPPSHPARAESIPAGTPQEPTVETAAEVVRSAESSGASEDELASAYGELAATQFRFGDLAGAEASYLRALTLLEDTHGIASRLLIAPLAGLAQTYAARGQHEHAIAFFRRAIVVSRRADGLFNLEQLPLLEQEISGFEALGDPLGVLADRQYMLAIAERNFGADDVRTLQPVRRLAELYESMEEYAHARNMYLRMRSIAAREEQRGNPIVVEALVGIGRNYREQYIRLPTSLEQQWVRDPVSGSMTPVMSLEPYQSPKPNREGRRSTAEALELLRAVGDPPPKLLADTLIEMGDWYAVLRKSDAAIPYYAEAWAIYSKSLADEPNPLSRPRLVFYRPPKASRRDENSVPGPVVQQPVHFRLTVDATGATRDITLEKSETSARRADLIRRSIEYALYSPRFAAGKPVPSDDVRFEAHWDALAGELPDSAATEDH
jgi:tetratricopeptide (TPR) repeat protein